jgi:ABC-type transport system substrate-binding protein
VDPEKRKQLCRQIQMIMLDECFTIPVAPQVSAFPYANYVKDFSMNMENMPTTGAIWLDK